MQTINIITLAVALIAISVAVYAAAQIAKIYESISRAETYTEDAQHRLYRMQLRIADLEAYTNILRCTLATKTTRAKAEKTHKDVNRRPKAAKPLKTPAQ